jgi:hypothetical protein
MSVALLADAKSSSTLRTAHAARWVRERGNLHGVCSSPPRRRALVDGEIDSRHKHGRDEPSDYRSLGTARDAVKRNYAAEQFLPHVLPFMARGTTPPAPTTVITVIEPRAREFSPEAFETSARCQGVSGLAGVSPELIAPYGSSDNAERIALPAEVRRRACFFSCAVCGERQKRRPGPRRRRGAPPRTASCSRRSRTSRVRIRGGACRPTRSHGVHRISDIAGSSERRASIQTSFTSWPRHTRRPNWLRPAPREIGDGETPSPDSTTATARP